MQFLLLYKELYYRHIYSKLQPTLEQRMESWLNYCDIFNLLLSVDTPLALELPNQWLWDMIDEFIYQFQVLTSPLALALTCSSFARSDHHRSPSLIFSLLLRRSVSFALE